jgi:N-acyl-D-amino-acid deacylase
LRHRAQGIEESVAETIKLAKETGVPVIINHFVPVIGVEKEYERALDMIEALPPQVELRFDIYPYASSLLPLYTYLPLWVQDGGVDIMLAHIKDEWLLPRIKKDMPRIDADRFMIAQARGNDFLVGKTLRDVMAMYELTDATDALLRLMKEMNLKGGVLYQNLNERLIQRAIASKRSFVASNAPSFGRMDRGKLMKSERTTSTFTRFLEMVFKHHLLPLDEAIRKITREPARMLGLAGRGEIKEGNIADLAVFHGNEVLYTVVNGKVAMRKAEFGDVFSGRVLRHSMRL